MAKFNLDEWWAKNVDPNISLLDGMYKEITQEAIAEVLRLHKIIEEDENALDFDDVDLSDVL
jgi:hypothetical protein